MQEILATQFDRVEKALATLVDSIAAYNPSPQAAVDLVAADDELSRGLDQLAQHQANHARIHLLRAQADALEEQLKASVEKLATLRHDLFETPATTFPHDSRPVPFDQLLQYATNISKHTIPPTYRERVPASAPVIAPEKEEDATQSAAPTNGISTPAVVSSEPAQVATAAADGQQDAEPGSSTTPVITEEEAEWLKKLNESQFTWYPWPSNDKIRQGNLHKIQAFREQNFNLDTFSIPAHEEEKKIKRLQGLQGLQGLQEAPGEGTPAPKADEVQPALDGVPRRPAVQPTNIFDDMDDD